MAIYTDSSGYPGSKLGTTQQYTFAAADTESEIYLNLTSPVNLVQGQIYWIAWNSESNIANIFNQHQGARATVGYYKALTYDGTMPDTFPAAGAVYYPKCVFGLT